MGEDKPRPFHERFDIEIEMDDAKRRFINRVINEVFDYLREEFGSSYTYSYVYHDARRAVASSMGIRFLTQKRFEYYVAGDFKRCLQALEAVYEALEGIGVQQTVSETIGSIVRASEVDLGVDWQPPVFVRTGAPLLDEHLVNEPLRWLSEPKYESVRKPFEKGLSHYLEAQNRPDRLADVITDMYEAVEALAKIVTERSGKDLSGNVERFISKVNASQHYKTLLRNYISYGNEFRHAQREGRPRPLLSEPEVEAFIYLTGLFIRLAIRSTD